MNELLKHIGNGIVVLFFAAVILIPTGLYLSELRLQTHVADSGGTIDARRLESSIDQLQHEQMRANERITEHCSRINAIEERLGIKHQGIGAEMRIYEREQKEQARLKSE